jgi:error-prone DNA polymerase
MIPLIVRSHYSLMRGTASPEALCRAARRMGYDRLALTDTDNLYGLWPFLAACRREGIIPMVGAEITEPGASRRAVCLAADRRGYAHLCRLLTRRHTAPDFRLREDVADLADGLVVLAPDPELLTFWHGAGVRTAGAMGRRPLPRRHPLREAARQCGVPCVAVPDSFFLSPGDHAVHRLLQAIDLNTILSRIPDRETAPPDAWLAPPEAYERRFAPCPEAVRAAHQLADEIGFTGPDFGIVMPPWTAGKGRCPEAALREAAYEGARRRYGDELSEPVVDRLEHELKTIAAMGFSAYFLIVRDIVIHSPRTCGRGSGAASLVAYCLGVTNVCPVKHNLYFERFLHPGRKDPPDIDVDFAWDERDDVLAAVLEKHRGHAAMVANHVLFQPRMAVRETAKVYGLPGAEIGRVTERMPWRRRPAGPDADLLSEIAAMPEARGLDLSDPWPEIFALARRIIGAPRYLSVHPGGVVITPAPIDRYVPVERAAKGVPIIQWEKDGAEDAGLVKIDLLGNRSLGVIRDAAANVRRNGVPFEEAGWEPEDDPETQAMVGRGETMGCFYIESPATRLLQKKAKKGDFAHMVIHSSIIRPAANDYIREYLRRLHGGEWNPIHPLLSDVLDDTYGIMVYQEDVSRAAVSMAGFSHAEADGLRKVLSKKDRAHRLRDRPLRDYRERFFAGAAARGVPADKTAQVWEMMMSFDGYSFCKPHSASYARVSFQAAWLKAHHPAEFMAAVIGGRIHGRGHRQRRGVLSNLRLRLRGPAAGIDGPPPGRQPERGSLDRRGDDPPGGADGGQGALPGDPAADRRSAAGRPLPFPDRFPGPGPARCGRGPGPDPLRRHGRFFARRQPGRPHVDPGAMGKRPAAWPGRRRPFQRPDRRRPPAPAAGGNPGTPPPGIRRAGVSLRPPSHRLLVRPVPRQRMHQGRRPPPPRGKTGDPPRLAHHRQTGPDPARRDHGIPDL